MTLTRISPEGFDIANEYLKLGSVQDVAQQLCIPEHAVVKALDEPSVKTYLNGVYMDLGYRNRDKLGALLDKMIEKKLEEAEETGIYTSKDLFDLITLAHKMRMDEIKAHKADNQTTVNVANFGGNSNYGKLMGKLGIEL